jgi:hypothetical protein
MTAPVSESAFIELDASLDGDASDDDLDDDLEDAGDGDEEDDELTEHAAPIVEPLSPLASDPIIPEPMAPEPMAPEPIAAPGARLPLAAPLTLTLTGPPGAPLTLAGPPSIATDLPATIVDGAPLPDLPDAQAASGPPPATALPAMAAPHAPTSPLSPSPWQAGQPASPADRVARSWAVIDLPAFDPEAFERQRSLVVRVAAGVVGFVVLLAIFAGHC